MRRAGIELLTLSTRRERFLILLAERGSAPEAADLAGLSRSLVYRELRTDGAFAERWHRAMAAFHVAEAVRRAADAKRSAYRKAVSATG